MTPEEILSHPARVLNQGQRESYFERGYLLLEKLISDEWIDQLRQKTDELIEQSRLVNCSGNFFDLAPQHSPEQPRVRRFKAPDQVDLYWQYANDIIADVSADLLGPDLSFHHS